MTSLAPRARDGLIRTVVVIEDEQSIAQAVAARLQSEGYATEIASDGPGGVALCDRIRPDLVVLDLMLPGLDGIEVCKQIQRERPVPVLMLTARDGESDLLVGLAVGADDYMTKPFSMRELIARVHALLRRADRAAETPLEAVVRVGDVELDATTRRVRVDDELVHLTPIEFDLVHYLAARPGRVSTREELLAQVWGYDVPSGRADGRFAHSHDPAQARVDDRAHRARRRLRGRGGTGKLNLKRPRPPERPLDPLPTLKLKISVIILAAVAVTVGVFFVGLKAGIWPSVAGVFAGLVALAVVWVLARGLTSPLREMVAATEAMARGDFTARVTDVSHDEIGTLARAFNQMAAELAETDRLRRDLVANVSHELRTPITALQAVLENLVDGVGKADPETLRTMLAQVERLGRLVQQLLDLSRLESGTLPLDRDLFDVRPMIEHAIRESQLHATDVHFEIEARAARLPARSRRRASAPGRREPRRERGPPLATAGDRDGPCGRRTRRWGAARSLRRRPRHSRERSLARVRTFLPRRLRPLVDATAVPASGSRSHVGSSSCTAATSASPATSPTAVAWSQPSRVASNFRRSPLPSSSTEGR